MSSQVVSFRWLGTSGISPNPEERPDSLVFSIGFPVPIVYFLPGMATKDAAGERVHLFDLLGFAVRFYIRVRLAPFLLIAASMLEMEGSRTEPFLPSVVCDTSQPNERRQRPSCGYQGKGR